MPSKTDGFVRLPNWLLDDSDLSLNELAVYIVLLRFRDHKTGKCYPGLSTIADRARMSRKTAERTVKLLEARQMIRVERRSTITENKPNVYEVAIANETPEHIWETSARGQRRPKRPRTPKDSESLGKGADGTPTDTESLAKDTESVPPGTPSLPNKNQENNIHEQPLTRTLPSAQANQFSFDGEDQTASDKQVNYLRDLSIQMHRRVPDDMQMQRWRKLTPPEATNQIRGYLSALGRPDEHDYPEWGTPEYEALSPAGKEFADTAGMPGSVFDYGFHTKENRTA